MSNRLENFRTGGRRPIEVLPPLFPITKERATQMQDALDRIRVRRFKAGEVFNNPEERQRGE